MIKRPNPIKAYENLEFLKSKDVKLIVVACNTASALALPTLQAEERIPVIGVLEPGARAAVRSWTGERWSAWFRS